MIAQTHASRSTGLECLSLVGKHHGLDFHVEQLAHEYPLEDGREPTRNRLQRIAKEMGLKAKAAKLNWSQLKQLGDAYPLIAQLQNGNYVILVGVQPSEESRDEQVFAFDPLADRSEFLTLSQSQLETAWSGDVLFLKKQNSLLDEKQPFGLRWFLPEIYRQKRAFLDVAAAALTIHLIALVTPLFFQIVIDKVVNNEAYSTLRVLGVGIVIALGFDAVLGYLRSYLLLHATSKLDIRLATRTFGHLLKLPMTFFERATAGTLAKHMQQTSSIREFLTGNLFMTILDCWALLVFLPMLFFYSFHLSLVVLGFSAAMAVVIGALLGPYQRRLEALYKAEGERQSLLVETIQGVSTIKALSIEPVQRKNWDDKAAQAVQMHYRVGKISIAAQTFSKLLEKLMTVSIVWIGAQLYFNDPKQLSIGALVAFQMLSGRVSAPLVQLVSLVHSYQEAALSVRMLGAVMNQAPENGLQGGLQPRLQGRIELDKITFQYNAQAEPALNDVSLAIPAGQVVGVVGRSGSGKTTLTRLIQGFYSPNGGVIRFDGLDMREIDLAHLRRNIGVVLQENFLFRGTVRENILMGKPNAGFDEVVRMAQLAGADEFIEQLPQSYDTMLEENGANLSGGQKQRLAIARALLTDPRILIFDEATSALDPDSEAIIQQNLSKIAAGRTVVIVSHRLSILTEADNVIVLERGRLADIAPHRTLLERCGIYRHLWNQQMGKH